VEEAAERIRPYLSQQRVLEAVEKLIEELRSSAEIESVLAS